MLQFRASVGSLELSIDLGLLTVSFFLPGSGFGRQRLFIRNAAGQTLARQDIQLDFRHVKPTAMLGRVNDFQTPDQPTSFLGRKGFVQGAQTVGVEVIHHQRDPLRLRPMHIDQLANGLGPVGLGALIGHHQMPPAGQWFREREHIGSAVAFVLVVETLASPRCGGKRRLRFDGQLLAQFVHADQWKTRIVWALVGFQHVFHVVNKLGIVLRGNAPHALLPRLQLVFLRQRRTVSCETASTMSSSTARSANSRKVHRACPDGAAPQHSATTLASFSPSRILARDSRACFLRFKADSKPSSTRRLRMFSTVCTVTWHASAMASSFQPGPRLPASASNSTWARVRFFAAIRSFFTNCESSLRSCLSSFTRYRLFMTPLLGLGLTIGEKSGKSVNPKKQS